jgi:hypothetical protein
MSTPESRTAWHHIVCRDCTFESLQSDDSGARRLAENHAATTGHRTHHARIQ